MWDNGNECVCAEENKAHGTQLTVISTCHSNNTQLSAITLRSQKSWLHFNVQRRATHLRLPETHFSFCVFFKWNRSKETPGPFHLEHPLPAVSVLKACCSANNKKKIPLIIFLCFRAQYAETGRVQIQKHTSTHSCIYSHKHTRADTTSLLLSCRHALGGEKGKQEGILV